MLEKILQTGAHLNECMLVQVLFVETNNEFHASLISTDYMRNI